MIEVRIELSRTKDPRESNRLTAEFNSLRTEILRENRDLDFVAGGSVMLPKVTCTLSNDSNKKKD